MNIKLPLKLTATLIISMQVLCGCSSSVHPIIKKHCIGVLCDLIYFEKSTCFKKHNGYNVNDTGSSPFK